MKRREFLFGSLQAALLFAPILAARRASAQMVRPKRAFFWVNSSGYPDPEAFFPTGTEEDFTLGPILSSLEHLQSDMTIVDGIDIHKSGPDPRGANHIRSVGKVLTAKDVLPIDDPDDADPGGISVDQLIARELGLRSIETHMDAQTMSWMRSRPFATGPRAARTTISETEVLWDMLFKPAPGSDAEQEQIRKARLRARQSILDGLGSEMARFRKELVGIEKLKLDIHEDAIRRAELSVAADLNAIPTPACIVPNREVTEPIMPIRAQAQFDLLYAAMLCDFVQMVGMKFAFSGYHWRYDWMDGIQLDTVHEDVHHRASTQRQVFIDTAKWDWQQLGGFVKRLKETPEGEGTMLDETLVVAISHFGKHHELTRLPVVLFGSARGQLAPGRYLKLAAPSDNDKLLTSVAHLMGCPISGIGDNPECGPLAELHG